MGKRERGNNKNGKYNVGVVELIGRSNHASTAPQFNMIMFRDVNISDQIL